MRKNFTSMLGFFVFFLGTRDVSFFLLGASALALIALEVGTFFSE